MVHLRWLWQTLIIALPSAPVTLAQLNQPAGYWSDKSGLLYFSVILLVLGISASLFSEISATVQAPAVRQFNDQLNRVLLAALISVARITGSHPLRVGVHVFRVSRGLFRRRLINIGGVRWGGSPRMVDPRWTRGKGVVGRAWHEGQYVAVHWDGLCRKAEEQGPDAWRQRTRADRFGLNWQELWVTSGYHTIVAAPIVDAATGTISGCVAIDFYANSTEVLTEEMKEILRDVAVKVQEIPRPPLVWTGALTR